MELVLPNLGLIIWMFITITIVGFLLGKFAWKPVMAGLKERENTISSALEAASAAREEMAKLQAENDSILKEARKERDEILSQARVSSTEMVEAAKQKAIDEGARMIDLAKEEIDNQKKAALTEVRNTAAILSVEIAEKIVRKDLDKGEAQQQLIAEYLKESQN